MPASGPGEAPYYAPPIPLWTPEEQEIPAVDSTAAGLDTVGIDETIPEELDKLFEQ